MQTCILFRGGPLQEWQVPGLSPPSGSGTKRLGARPIVGFILRRHNRRSVSRPQLILTDSDHGSGSGSDGRLTIVVMSGPMEDDHGGDVRSDGRLTIVVMSGPMED